MSQRVREGLELIRGMKLAIDQTTRGADGRKLSGKRIKELEAATLELENRGWRFLSGEPDVEEELMASIVASAAALKKCIPRANHAPLTNNILPAYLRILEKLQPQDTRSRVLELVREEMRSGKLHATRSVNAHVLQVMRLRPEWDFYSAQIKAAPSND